MKKALKVLAIAALIAASGAAGQALLANCQDPASPYEVRQCSNSTWFAPPPPTAGPISGSWWAVGFGNKPVVQGANPAPDGSGFAALVGTNGIAMGVDSGALPAYDAAGGLSLDLVDATLITGIGAPPGSRCFSSRANWGTPGMDSCIDVNRTAAGIGDTASVSDNYINRYWDSTPTPPGYPETYVYLNHQLDPPMGVLLTEGSGQYFAAAFFASAPKRVPRDADLDPGQFYMGAIVNGDMNAQGENNVVPWQPIPRGNVSAQIVNILDPNSPRNVSFDWSATPVRFIHDNSNRPCMLTDNVTPCAAAAMTDVDGAGPIVPGVGVHNYGPMIHHVIERADLDTVTPGNPCLTNWTPLGGTAVDFPATQASALGVAVHSCLRLRTTFGKTPEATYIASPISTTNRDINRRNSQPGKLGDVGYSVVSAEVKVGGPLVSQHANLRAVTKERNSLRVVFDTDAELSVTSFDVVGIDGRGGQRVLGTVACKQCTTGLSASYDELIAGTKLQGSKAIQVVMQPSGVRSNTLSLK